MLKAEEQVAYKPVMTKAPGLITSAPELGWLPESGLAVCRFAIAAQVGGATRSPVFHVYVKQCKEVERSKDLAIRCAGLEEGSLVFVEGEQRHRWLRRRGKDVLEVAIFAADVRLRALPA